MDLATILGLILGIAALLGSALLEGAHLSALLNLPAFVLIVGGSIGATAVSFSLSDLLRVASYLRDALFTMPFNLLEHAKKLVEYAQMARRDGILALDAQLELVSEPFVKTGLQLVVDGCEPELVQSVLTSELEKWESRERAGEKIFEVAGGYAPTMGVMGAVFGLMHALGYSEDPQKMAGAIAVAFIATIYGVGFANLMFLPIGAKLKVRVGERRVFYEMTMEGIASIQSGENPRMLVQRLLPYLPTGERPKLAALFGGRSEA